MAGPMSVFTPVQPAPQPAPAPPPSLIETVGLQFGLDAVGPDWGLNQANAEGRILGQIRDEAIKRGYDPNAAARAAAMDLSPQSGDSNEWQRRADDLLGFVARVRTSDPKFLPQYAGLHSYADVAALGRQQRQQKAADYSVQLQDSPLLGRLIGDVGHGFTDPVNYIPIGGAGAGAAVGVARRIGRSMLRTGAGNAALAAAEEPFVYQDARSLGIEHGAGDVASDIATAGLFGAVLGGLHSGGGALIDHFRGTGTLADRATVAGMETAVPRANWTPDETAAAHVLTRTSDVAESSPFEPGAAGDAHHVASLDTAYRAQIGEPAAPDVPRVTPAVADSLSAALQVKMHIMRAESGGNDHAANSSSSASGRYQFTMPTWLSYYKRRYGATEGNASIWAKRFDPWLQEVLMTDLIADNSRMLRSAGQAETPGNLYLLHFAGPDGLKVLGAAAETPLEHLLPARDFKGNPFLKGKTAGWLAAWADRRMGGAGEVHLAGSPVEPKEFNLEEARAEREAEEALPDPREEPRDFAADREGLAAHDLPVLRAGLFGTPEEHAAAQLAVWREAMPAEASVAGAPSASPASQGPFLDLKAKERAPMRRSGPIDVMQAVADAGGLRDDEGHDLVNGRNIPKFIRGAGVIVREGGRTVDEIGEHLWEQGYFGPHSTTKRPSEAAVLDLVDRAAHERVFKPEEAGMMAERAAARLAMPEDEARFDLAEHAADNGIQLDRRTLDDALMHRANGETVEGAVARAVHDAAYRDAEPPAGLERFDDPDGEGAQAQADSLEHDLRMAIEAGDGERYRLTEDGPEQSLAEIFEELDADAHAVEALSGCMAPTAVAAE